MKFELASASSWYNTPLAVVITTGESDSPHILMHPGLNLTPEGEWIPAPGFGDLALEMTMSGRKKDADIAAFRKELDEAVLARDGALKRIETLELSMKHVAVNLRNGAFTPTMNASELEAALDKGILSRDVSECLERKVSSNNWTSDAEKHVGTILQKILDGEA